MNNWIFILWSNWENVEKEEEKRGISLPEVELTKVAKVSDYLRHWIESVINIYLEKIILQAEVMRTIYFNHFYQYSKKKAILS
jgi:hypothetical protein